MTLPIIPRPAHVKLHGAKLPLGSAFSISCHGWEAEGNLLAGYLKEAGYALKEGGVPIRIQEYSSFDPEQPETYELTVDGASITLKVGSKAGCVNGIQTLRQLLDGRSTEIPTCTILDWPRFSWRGMHLDVSRHFTPVDRVKKFVDLLALHKMNIFHWHLTDDQGWRIEIKKYPLLQEIASKRAKTRANHGAYFPAQFSKIPHEGYYTQEEIKEVVAYAALRNITVVPEIEMPGHATAAVAAYPHLSCKGEPVTVAEEWGIWEPTYCPSKATTYAFLEGVLEEVLALFPSQFIHIGGDEAPKDHWKECPDCQRLMKERGYTDVDQLQSHLVRHFDAFLAERGRRLIGWDEILEGGLASGATVMSWRGEEGAIEAVKAGHNAVMSASQRFYFDMYQTKGRKTEPLAIGGYIPWQMVYEYDPIPSGLTDAEGALILGGQGQLWTEYIPTEEILYLRAFPRIPALSEVVWSPKALRDEADFHGRLKDHEERLKGLGVVGHPVDSVK